MAWQSLGVDHYEATLISYITPGFPGFYAFIYLYWQGKERATLLFLRDTETVPSANYSKTTAGFTEYIAFFSQAQYRDAVDLLRNEKPVVIQWNDSSKGFFLSTTSEPIGEDEMPS
jgi:hypothetical protein